jgi:MFS transporter, DHA1 family, inner membrane transport protein
MTVGTPSEPVTPEDHGIQKTIWTTILPARLLLNAQGRIVYPFLPVISRGLGLPLETAALLLAIRGLIGATSPAFGYLSDRFGRKTLMLAGLVAMIVGAVLVAKGQTFAAALFAFALLGFAKACYDPAMQAYIADAVPYEKRGQALGVIEYSWAGSWLVGVPVAGFLIARWSWRTPFLLIALLGVISLLATWRSPALSGRQAVGPGQPPVPRTRPDLSALRNRSTVAALAVSGLVIMGNENFLVIYGAWMEKQFVLSSGRLGLLSTVVSVAELAGAALIVASVDRLGKRGGLLLGLAFNIVAYLLLPFMATSLIPALAGVILLAMTSEFSIVATLPLVSEMAPKARGTVMAIHAALTALAAALASLFGPRLWQWGGLGAVTVASALAVVLAFVLLWAWVRERQGAPALGLPAAGV